MFTKRSLSDAVASVRETHVPDALVFDCARDFETVPASQAEELALVTDRLVPASHSADWVPADAPDAIHRYAGSDLTIGMAGDGGVTWTRQTDPPVVLVKPRLAGSPDRFIQFLIAEAFVELGLDAPEHFLGFFKAQYPAFVDATAPSLDPAATYQLASACYDAFLGRQTGEVFAAWDGELFEAWIDAGERLEPRLESLPRAVAREETSFADAAELACNAVKHACDIPRPFDALDTGAYLDHGPEYAVEWADRTITALE